MNVLLPLSRPCSSCSGRRTSGQLRGALQSSFPDHYRWIVAGVVAVAALVGDRVGGREAASTRPARVSRPRIAAGPGSGCGTRSLRWPSRSARSTRAWCAAETRTSTSSRRFISSSTGSSPTCSTVPGAAVPIVSGVVFAACAGLAVGVADEWVQWFVPGRVGEMHDVGLNAVAVGCGLLFSVAVHPPASLACRRQPARVSCLVPALSGLIIAVAGFVDRVHLGYEVSDGQVGIFRSQYDARTLAAASGRPARPLEGVAAAGRGLQARGSLPERGAVARSAAEHCDQRPATRGRRGMRTRFSSASTRRFSIGGPVASRAARGNGAARSRERAWFVCQRRRSRTRSTWFAGRHSGLATVLICAVIVAVLSPSPRLRRDRLPRG